MLTKSQKINVKLDHTLIEKIKYLAEKDGISMSLKIRDLVKEALEIEEDAALSVFAEKRERTFDRNKALKHNEVWEI